jgi:hypothetical protein
MSAKLINPVFISWYLAILFLLAMLVTSAITVIPAHETFVGLLMAGCLACSVFFMVVAIALQRRMRRGLDLGVFRVVYAVFALVITVAVLIFVVG